MFQFSNLIPLPLAEKDLSSSEVWGQDWALAEGTAYFLEAPSGRGKTTFQHLLYGLRQDYSGQISWKGQDIRQFSAEDWAVLRQKELAIIFQDLRLFPQLSMAENLILKQELNPAMDVDQLKAAAEELDMMEHWDRPTGLLSYGQKQRIAIIRALSQPFSLLLMDEPFAHLDQENIRRACQLIQRRCEEEKASFLIASLGDDYFLNYDKTIRL